MIQNQKTAAKPDKNKELITNAKKFEDAKEYNTLKFAETIFNIRKNNAQVSAGYAPDMEGFKAFCGEYLNTGYHTAMRYISIHKMTDSLAVDPAVAEDLGYSKLRTIASIANVDNIGMCLEKAQELTTSELEEWVKEYKKGKNPDDPEGESPMMKKFIFPASEEEVPIIDSIIRDVKALLSNNNNTTALIHICQSYMEFAYPHERTKAIETIQRQGEAQKKAQEIMKEKVVDPTTDKKAQKESVYETAISENDIPKATLPELLAFARVNGIELDAKHSTNKSAVKARIIDILTERALTEDTEETTLPEVPEEEFGEAPVEEEFGEALMEEDVVDTTEEASEATPEAVEVPVEVPVEKVKKGRKAKTEVPEGTPTEEGKEVTKPKGKAKEVKPEEPVEILPDPAAEIDEEKEITFESAINEIRNVIDKKHLIEVAESYGIELSADDISSKTAEALIEDVVIELCDREGHDYIPPQDDDTSDLDDILAGK